ncbi:hypothetical protein J7481_14430 [Labrenzia sp. R4_2]|uniref:hypothetical protein n=1 Tax=Labrenzia sp. R4_2 TaxID=2821107 RepID=UPI001AD9E38A|nr:hypothetical protein [Labrenzia sp. R4_2]MBO9420697.1 hypothetical protein [Labrenzia sp. R4_2]
MTDQTGRPLPSSFIAFNSFAGSRGDGLHPRLAEALAKTGSVSGPPLSSETADNVIRVCFSKVGTHHQKTGSEKS